MVDLVKVDIVIINAIVLREYIKQCESIADNIIYVDTTLHDFS